MGLNAMWIQYIFHTSRDNMEKQFKGFVIVAS
jgi:hypothetical protein